MRRVTLPPCPALLDGPDSAGAREIGRATEYYDSRPRPTRAFKHAVYKRAAIRDALNAAFGFKCAYCESRYGGTQPVDVEHYRPKGEVITPTGTSIKPGYYWLAATWDNLLPSCIDCNRQRKHTGRDGVVRSLGKGNNFPLAEERDRVAGPQADVTRERPLLLSPYADRPERHLEFLANGVLRPSPSTADADEEDARGRATIDVAGLNRPQLADDRAGHALRIAIQLEAVADAEHNIRRDPTDEVFLRQLRRELQNLRRLQETDVPYLTMTKQMIEAYKRRATGA